MCTKVLKKTDCFQEFKLAANGRGVILACKLYFARKLGYSCTVCIFLDLLGSVSQQNFLQSRLNSAMGPLSEHVFRFREKHKKVHITYIQYTSSLIKGDISQSGNKRSCTHFHWLKGKINNNNTLADNRDSSELTASAVKLVL